MNLGLKNMLKIVLETSQLAEHNHQKISQKIFHLPTQSPCETVLGKMLHTAPQLFVLGDKSRIVEFSRPCGKINRGGK